MDIFSILSLLGGLALFLFGMHTMGKSLEKSAGNKMESILEKITNNTLKGLLLGAGVTAIIQSSTATTVMVVGFVNSGIMKLRQAVGVIMGANLGTTITSWILSLTGIESSNTFMKLLKPASFSPVFAIVGIIMLMFFKDSKRQNIGSILIGFGILMTGMDTMSKACEPLAQVPEFGKVLTMFQNPILGILAGAVLTAIVQSSSASVGILQALTVTGSISFSVAIPIVMGQNIGTCITALISTIGANKNAKRAGFIHLYFNVIGAVILYLVYLVINSIWGFGFSEKIINPGDVAIIHTVFNLLSTMILLPFAGLLEKLAIVTIKDKSQDKPQPFIDERFLQTPAVAVSQCKKIANEMADISKDMLIEALSLIEKYDDKKAEDILNKERIVDSYEDKLGTYLVKLSGKNMNGSDNREVSRLLLSIGDFERIADHGANIVYSLKTMKEKKMKFSPQAIKELKVVSNSIEEIINITVDAFKTAKKNMAYKVEPLEQVIERLYSEIKEMHIERLKAGKSTVERGFVHSDLLTSFKRVADHCSNIAIYIIQINKKALGTHEYIKELRANDMDFKNDYKFFREKYRLS
ncbi:MAG: Na/Pi cotransporter family protein [Ruminococcus sp.]